VCENWLNRPAPPGVYRDQVIFKLAAPLTSPVVVLTLTGAAGKGEVRAPALLKAKVPFAKEVWVPAVPPVSSAPGIEMSYFQAFEPVLVKVYVRMWVTPSESTT